jgi:hypothetical protein
MGGRKRLEQLAAKCGMTVYDLNTNVVRADDGDGRVSVDGGLSPMWGDHMSLRWYVGDGKWAYAHFSADKAELIGRLLIARAEWLRTQKF